MPEETVPLIPDPARTMEGLRDMGYSFETAVADLVDNSIAANATTVDVSVQLDFRGQVRLAIADNGHGMDRKHLVEAMTYGSVRRPDPASLGKFGLGLKTASTAWCRRLSVISRPSSQVSPMMATWDLDYVADRGEWLLLITDEPDAEAVAHLDRIASKHAGTVVLWTKVDRLLRSYADPTGPYAKRALKGRCDDLRFHLAMTYQRFLAQTGVESRIFSADQDAGLVLAKDTIEAASIIVPSNYREPARRWMKSRYIEDGQVLFQCERCSALNGYSDDGCANCGGQ